MVWHVEDCNLLSSKLFRDSYKGYKYVHLLISNQNYNWISFETTKYTIAMPSAQETPLRIKSENLTLSAKISHILGVKRLIFAERVTLMSVLSS